MSADNWTTCPRCALIKQDEIAAMDADIARAYGSTPIQDFDRLRSVRDSLIAEQQDPERTLREDYEFYGIDEGLFHVDYSARCTKCGFGHTFKHSQDLEVKS